MGWMGKSKNYKVETTNFISYNDMTLNEDFLLFQISGLESFFQIAVRVLHGQMGVSPGLRVGIFPGLGKSIFPNTQLKLINLCISDALELVGKHTNKKYGPSAKQQHQFFQRKFFYSSFGGHLIESIKKEKEERLKASFTKKPAHVLDVPYEIDIETTAAKSKRLNLQKENEITGKNRLKDFKYCQLRLSESELKAVGALYFIGLVHNAILKINRKNGKWTLMDTEMFSLFQAMASLRSLFDYSDQYLGIKMGPLNKKSTLHLNLKSIAERIVSAHPNAKTNKLKILIEDAATKAGISNNQYPTDKTIEKWIRTFRSIKLSK